MMKTADKKSLSGSSAVADSAQTRFLTQMIEEHKKVAVYLVSGIKLEGEIVAFDQFVILLKGAMTDAVYKHAVSTIQPIEAGAHPLPPSRPREGASRTPTIRQARPRSVRGPDES